MIRAASWYTGSHVDPSEAAPASSNSMPKRLIIVESPSKARTLAKFLGSDYTIKASMGHVRDLPKSRLGVDVEGGFAPEYEVTRETQIRDLRSAARGAEGVLLASDPDREGEAIAWHLAEALKLKNPERVVFHEITRPAVEAALASPRAIDRDLVFAQEARRVIDRLVGYQLSPLLWKKVRTGLSAGRVQSVAVRLVVDREREIEAFVPEESWTVEALLETDSGEAFTTRLYSRIGDTGDEQEASKAPADAGEGATAATEPAARLKLTEGVQALEVMASLGVDAEGRPSAQTPRFRVATVDARDTSRSAPLPYTTSTLQQDASSRLRLSPKRTMSVAQQLYEGVDVGADGSVGLITYMRTDSTRVSDIAHVAASAFVAENYGKPYVRSGAPRRRAAKRQGPVQDAHEAIRPTDVSRTPESLETHLNKDQLRLYGLIWRRFVASEMSPARFRNTRVDTHAGDYVFRGSGSVLVFDGFTRVLRRDDDREEKTLPQLTVDQLLRCQRIDREQHFTQPPPRYTEASLVKELEERGIGRPSTYAPTIEVIQERGYVRQEERRLHPTELGKTVDAVLRQHFPDIVDVAFTADLEKRLDRIEEGKRKYEPTVRDWYGPFARTLEKAESTMERVLVSTGETCPECEQGELVMRQSRYGEFIGCSRYPECKYIKRETAAAPQATGEMCPQCGRELLIRQSKRGPFVGCSGYPECTYVRGDAPAPAGETTEATGAVADGAAEQLGACPQCGKPLAKRTSRRGPFVGCTGYPECRYIQPSTASDSSSRSAPQPVGRDCPDCGKPLVLRQSRRGPFVGCSGYPKCRHVERSAEGVSTGQSAAPDDAAAAEDLGQCPDCGKPLVRRRGKYGSFVGCSGYPECRYRPERSTAAVQPVGTASS
jgi:DNA topoisomerase I